MSAALLTVENLAIDAGKTRLLQALSFAVEPGECLTLVGESGAGKSLLLQAVMGALPAGLTASGAVALAGQSSLAARGDQRRPHWGRRVALLPQEPWLALDPTMRSLPQVAETHAFVAQTAGGWPAAQARADADLQRLGLHDAGRLYPWQLSGGMAQRVAFAAATAAGAPLLLVDEPTKGLDALASAQVLAQMRRVLDADGAVLAITHDLAVARTLGGRLAVMREGVVVEQGSAAAVLREPQHEYTRRLLAAEPSAWPARAPSGAGEPVVSARSVSKAFGRRPVIDGLSLTMHAGERVAVRGASGCGKTTLGNLMVGLLKPDAGEVQRAAGLPAHAFQKLYQDPAAAFAPRVSLAESLRDLCGHVGSPWREVEAAMGRLRLPVSLLQRRPGQVSGGELQRVALIRVLMAKPALVFADEPTSRLDPLTQQDTLSVLLDAQEKARFALLLVTHDAHLAEHVAQGRVVEC